MIAVTFMFSQEYVEAARYIRMVRNAMRASKCNDLYSAANYVKAADAYFIDAYERGMIWPMHIEDWKIWI